MTEAPDLLAEVHADYVGAGATLHTANTFRTQPQALGEGWIDALRGAVRIVRGVVPPACAVLGSMAPVEDCYRPDLSPGAEARAQHREVAGALADAGCDVLLCETFANGQEAIVAAEEALATGLPVWLSLTAGPFGDLLSPTELARIGTGRRVHRRRAAPGELHCCHADWQVRRCARRARRAVRCVRKRRQKGRRVRVGRDEPSRGSGLRGLG